MASYVLSWRRKKANEDLQLNMFMDKQFRNILRQNPGIRWKPYIPIEDSPINYLEIGAFTGENIIDVSKSYCKNSGSKMYCIDPWTEYSEYPEYKDGIIKKVYNLFIENMQKEGLLDKLQIYRDFSHNVIPTLQDDFFDLIFVDGNHETEFVYKDGVMSLQKLKPGGYMIFDDYDWSTTKQGVNKFVEEHKSQIRVVGDSKYQLFIQKL